MNYFSEELEQELQSQVSGGNVKPVAGGLGANPNVSVSPEQESVPYVQPTASGIIDNSVDTQDVIEAVTAYNNGENADPEESYETLKPLEQTLDLGRAAAIDAAMQAANRDAVGIRESLRPSVTDAGGADVDSIEDLPGADVDAKAGATDTSISVQASAVPEGDVKEAQTVLNTLNLYRNPIDGLGGRGTKNAIQTYQYRAGIPVTGELDTATREALGSNEVTRDERPSDYDDPLLALLSEGENTTYSSANDYNSPQRKTEWSVYGSYFSDRYNKPISEMTLDEIQDIQAGGYGNREVFAVGAYQIIPPTFSSTIERMGLSGDTVFDAETQNAMGRDLLLNKPGREDLRAYLLGQEGASETAALTDLAREWASMPDPITGRSRYEGQSAHVPLAEVRQALREQRNIIMKEYGRTFESEE
jgi:peptidoglycan hydrolase-like protein with peptidoglycan-binding domain